MQVRGPLRLLDRVVCLRNSQYISYRELINEFLSYFYLSEPLFLLYNVMDFANEGGGGG